MWRAGLFACVLSSVTLAGCVGSDLMTGQQMDDSLDDAPVRFELADMASAGQTLLYEGATLAGQDPEATNSYPPFVPQPPAPDCAEANCERVPLVVHDTGGKALAIMVEWEAQDESWPTLGGPGYYLGDASVRMDTVVLKDGTVVADVEESFHYGAVGIIEDPEPGVYEVQTVAAKGTASYLLAVRVQDADPFLAGALDGELLPDLVALPPDHPTFAMPFGHEAGTPGGDVAAGCGPDELLEDRDVRCLRFAGIIGNQGPGDFLTVLDYGQAQAALTGMGGNWEQVIFTDDGSSRRVPIGPADYHEVHGHFHILDFVATQLYAYDEDTGERGEPMGEGRKMGFCIIDGGLIDTLGPVVPPKYHGGGCCYLAGICQMDMLSYDEFQMGMSPNWYDIYPWWRSDQYVEVFGLPDGVYELVTVINPDGLIVEADYDNNEASAVLRVTGDTVELVDMRTQAKLGPHPDADWGYAAQQEEAGGEG